MTQQSDSVPRVVEALCFELMAAACPVLIVWVERPPSMAMLKEPHKTWLTAHAGDVVLISSQVAVIKSVVLYQVLPESEQFKVVRSAAAWLAGHVD
jgi:hypothetical protein